MYRNHTHVSEINTSYIVKQEICMRPTPTPHTTTTQSLMNLIMHSLFTSKSQEFCHHSY